MTIGTTANAVMDRNSLVSRAFELVGIFNPGPARLKNSLVVLNSIMRELDKDVDFLWAVSPTPTAITLQANLATYASSAGLPTDVLRLETAKFRDSDGTDTPVDILTLESRAAIIDKYTQDSIVRKIYLTEDRDLSNRSLLIWPILGEVETQSELIGTDTNNYLCIRSHSGHADKRPITGDDWTIYWKAGGSSGVAYAADTEYVAPELLLLWYRRPLFDFDLATDNPDVPLGWDKLLMFKLAHLLSFSIKDFDVMTRSQLKAEILTSENKLKPSKVKKTNNIYNKVLYY